MDLTLGYGHSENKWERFFLSVKTCLTIYLCFYTYYYNFWAIQVLTVNSSPSFKHEVQQSINKETSLFWRVIRGHASTPRLDCHTKGGQERIATYKSKRRTFAFHLHYEEHTITTRGKVWLPRDHLKIWHHTMQQSDLINTFKDMATAIFIGDGSMFCVKASLLKS